MSKSQCVRRLHDYAGTQSEISYVVLANVRYYYFGLAGTLQKNYFNFATLTKYNYKFIYVLFLRSVLVRTRARTDFSCYSHTNKKTRHHVTRYSIFNWTTFLSNVHVTVLPSEQNSGQTKNKFSFGHDQRSQLQIQVIQLESSFFLFYISIRYKSVHYIVPGQGYSDGPKNPHRFVDLRDKPSFLQFIKMQKCYTICIGKTCL